MRSRGKSPPERRAEHQWDRELPPGFEILKRIGAGGMAEVFLARQTVGAGVERPVVIKRMRQGLSSDPLFVSMFVQEARVAAQLQHPNIVQIYDVIVAGTCPCIVMEYLDGFDVRWLARRSLEKGQPVPLSAVAAVGAGAAHGLAHAHRKRGMDGQPLGIVHRDISPHNLFVTRDGVVKVLDFGIAKSGKRVTATQEGGIKGKVPYMSPEQLRGDAVDASSDLFSLGVVLWETATGRRLFKRDSVEEVIRAVVASPIPAPSSVAPHLPPRFDEIVGRALERDRSARHAAAEELAEDLEELAHVLGVGSSQLLLSRLIEKLARPGEEQSRLPPSEVDTDVVTVIAHVTPSESGEREVPTSPGENGPHASRPPTAETTVEGVASRPRSAVPTAEGLAPVSALPPRSEVPTTYGGFEAGPPPATPSERGSYGPDAPADAAAPAPRSAVPTRYGGFGALPLPHDPAEQALVMVEARLDLEAGPSRAAAPSSFEQDLVAGAAPSLSERGREAGPVRRPAPSVFGHDFEAAEGAGASLDLAVDVARERKAQVFLEDLDRRAKSVAGFGDVPGVLGAPAYAFRVRRRLAWLRRRTAILRVAVETARAEQIDALSKIGEAVRSSSPGRRELVSLLDGIAHAERQVGILVAEAADAGNRERQLITAARATLRSRLADLGKRALELAIVDPDGPAAKRALAAEERARERTVDLDLYERAQCMYDPAAVKLGWTVMAWFAAIAAATVAVVYALGPF